MFAFNKILVGDWENGKLLELSLNLFKDEDSPIVWIRTFPHMTNNNEKITYNSFDLDAEVGTIQDQEENPLVSLSWSDDKGVTYGNPVMQSMGKTGQYWTVPSWNRLGQARDRVFKVSGSADMLTAINGAFIDFKKAKH
jgi:glycine cleavage system regulatory protein